LACCNFTLGKESTRVLKVKAGLLLVVCLIALGVWYLKQGKSTLPVSLRDFGVRDTAAINKIFLADKAGNQVLLERVEGGHWLLNKKSPARNDVINNLLLTIHSLEVKMPLPEAAHNSVVAQLAAKAVKIEIFLKGQLFKTYFVGGPTQDLLGTYMLLENSDRVFIMHIPGFNGFLSTRYTPLEENWKERFLFKVQQGKLSAIEIKYSEKPERSFYLDLKTGMLDNKKPVSPLEMRNYERLFQATPFEYRAQDIKATDRNALLKTKPVASIDLHFYSGKQTKTLLFKMPKDPDRLFALSADSDLFVVQHFVFDKILRCPSDFKIAP
jgi:hypothetical protein